MQGKVRGSDVSSLEQFFTEDMVNGLLKRCHADGTGHALSLHGPDAQIMDRLQNDNVNMASKFNNSKEMLNATHESITKGNLTQTRGVKLTFDYNLNKPINITTGVKNPSLDVPINITSGEHTGVVRTVVIFTPGKFPDIKTSFPKA